MKKKTRKAKPPRPTQAAIGQKIASGKPLTLVEALTARGVTAERLAAVIVRGMRGDLKSALKAAEMAMRARGDYKQIHLVQGQIDHDHHPHPLDETPEERRRLRLQALAKREKLTQDDQDIIDIVGNPTPKPPPGFGAKDRPEDAGATGS